jgi:hypothetical protein
MVATPGRRRGESLVKETSNLSRMTIVVAAAILASFFGLGTALAIEADENELCGDSPLSVCVTPPPPGLDGAFAGGTCSAINVNGEMHCVFALAGRFYWIDFQL